MKLQVIAVSNRPPDWARLACDDYAKRLPSDWQLQSREIKPADRIEGKTAGQLMTIEAQRLQATLKGYLGGIVVLDERGKAVTSRALLGLIQSQNRDRGGVAFIIGGPDGLAPNIKQMAHAVIQLSALTLPHAMVKVLLLEQIYRAAAIAKGHPYHRE